MASSFPGSIDNFTDPLTTSTLNSPSHAGQHQDLNDAVEKIETYMGLVKVIPTATNTGNTVGATGTITIGSGVSAVDLRGCFSALYDSYRVVWSNVACSSGSAAFLYKLLVGTTATTAGFYGNTQYIVNGAAGGLTGANRSNTAYGECGNTMTTYRNSGWLEIQQPFLATATMSSFSATDENYWRIGVDILRNSTSYDGFQFYPLAGTLTGGTIRVYGYRN